MLDSEDSPRRRGFASRRHPGGADAAGRPPAVGGVEEGQEAGRQEGPEGPDQPRDRQGREVERPVDLGHRRRGAGRHAAPRARRRRHHARRPRRRPAADRQGPGPLPLAGHRRDHALGAGGDRQLETPTARSAPVGTGVKLFGYVTPAARGPVKEITVDAPIPEGAEDGDHDKPEIGLYPDGRLLHRHGREAARLPGPPRGRDRGRRRRRGQDGRQAGGREGQAQGRDRPGQAARPRGRDPRRGRQAEGARTRPARSRPGTGRTTAATPSTSRSPATWPPRATTTRRSS